MEKNHSAWGDTDSERQLFHVFSQMWTLALDLYLDLCVLFGILSWKVFWVLWDRYSDRDWERGME